MHTKGHACFANMIMGHNHKDRLSLLRYISSTLFNLHLEVLTMSNCNYRNGIAIANTTTEKKYSQNNHQFRRRTGLGTDRTKLQTDLGHGTRVTSTLAHPIRKYPSHHHGAIGRDGSSTRRSGQQTLRSPVIHHRKMGKRSKAPALHLRWYKPLHMDSSTQPAREALRESRVMTCHQNKLLHCNKRRYQSHTTRELRAISHLKEERL